MFFFFKFIEVFYYIVSDSWLISLDKLKIIFIESLEFY